MNIVKNIFAKKHAKKWATLAIGGTLTFGAYSLARDIQVAIENKPSFQTQTKIQQIKPIPLPEPQPAQQDQPQPSQSKQQTKQSSPPPQEVQPEPKQEPKLQRIIFREMKQLKEFKIEDAPQPHERIMIVADLPYNKQFEDKIIKQINQITQQFGDVKVYKKDLSDQNVKKQMKSELKAVVKDQTLFLLKNPYEKGLNNIDFDIFIQFPHLLVTYLNTVATHNSDNIGNVISSLAKLSPHQSCLVYLYDKNETEQKQKERLLAAKYIEMEMAVNNLSGVKLEVVEKSAAIESKLIDEATARVNSVHLFRKHNIYTPYEPNYYLKRQQQSFPFHRLADIALFTKGKRDLMISHYLSSLETFDAMANPAPFVCTLRVDRNKISDEEYTKLMRVFGQLKSKNLFPDVAYALKLKGVPFAGKDAIKNKDWQITIANVDELDKQAMMHEIKNQKQLDMLGYKDSEYLKTTHQYLYGHNVINSTLVEDFIKKGLKGELPKYYKSDQPHPLAPIRQMVGSQFNPVILEDDCDHVVYQYSAFCPTCKRVSPIIGAFAKVVQEKGLGLKNVEFHKMDANKNRVQGQLSSPYIPNIFYYKKQWKNKGPVRFPIDLIGSQGLISLYAFCAITNQLQSMNWNKIDEAIQAEKKFKEEIKTLL